MGGKSRAEFEAANESFNAGNRHWTRGEGIAKLKFKLRAFEEAIRRYEEAVKWGDPDTEKSALKSMGAVYFEMAIADKEHGLEYLQTAHQYYTQAAELGHEAAQNAILVVEDTIFQAYGIAMGDGAVGVAAAPAAAEHHDEAAAAAMQHMEAAVAVPMGALALAADVDLHGPADCG